MGGFHEDRMHYRRTFRRRRFVKNFNQKRKFETAIFFETFFRWINFFELVQCAIRNSSYNVLETDPNGRRWTLGLEIGGSRVNDVSHTWQNDERSAQCSPQKARRRRFSTLLRPPYETFTRSVSETEGFCRVTNLWTFLFLFLGSNLLILYLLFSLNAFAGSLEESLWFLHKYVRDAAEKEESLDNILIPMLENVQCSINDTVTFFFFFNSILIMFNWNAWFYFWLKNKNKKQSLRYKDVKHLHGVQSMLLLNWLFRDEFLFQAIATNLAKIIATKDDRFIALGWCTLVRGLVEYENAMSQYPLHGN